MPKWSEEREIIKRSRHRDDRLSNLKALCRLHHDLKHPEKNKLHWKPKPWKQQEIEVPF